MHDVERELKDLGERTEVTYGSVPARRIVRRARLRRTFAIAIPTAAAVLLAMVVYPTLADLRRGDGGGPADLAAVARATEAAETARVELEMTMEIDGETHTTRGVGEVDFVRRRSHLRTEGTGLGGMDEAEMISIGDTTYQRTLGSKWVEYEMDGGAFGAGAGPADMLPYLETMSEEVTDLGNEELDGVSVTHYRATIDPGIFGDLGPAAVTTEFEFDPMHVWVDDSRRLRKLTFGTTVHDEHGSDASVEMTMRLWDFGVPVDVVAPDPEDVTDEPLRGGEDGSGSIGAVASSGDTKFVLGESGMSEPFLTLVLDDSGTYLVCVQAMPARATGAMVLHDATGDVILDFAPYRGAGHASDGRCAPGVTHETGDAVLGEPSDYTLRVETKRGGVVVPLSTTGSPLTESDE